MSRLIITELSVHGCPCIVCFVTEDQNVMELRLEAAGKKSILNNIYVGQVENIASNIKAAFVRFGEGIQDTFPWIRLQMLFLLQVERTAHLCVRETSCWFRYAGML